MIVPYNSAWFLMVFYSFQVVAVDRQSGERATNTALAHHDIGARDCEQPVLNPCNGLRGVFCESNVLPDG